MSEQYNLTKSKTDIEILNSNQIDWISLNNRASYDHEQYLLGHKLKNDQDLQFDEDSSGRLMLVAGENSILFEGLDLAIVLVSGIRYLN